MDYKITNDSLSKVYETFQVKTLMQLTEDQLRKACEMLSIIPTLKKVKMGKTSVYVVDRPATVALIEKTNTFDCYIGVEYMSQEQLDELSNNGYFEELKKSTTGRDHLETMERFSIGVVVKPGKTGVLNMSENYFEEHFKKLPAVAVGKVRVETSDGKLIETTAPLTDIEINDELNKKRHGELQEMARALGHKKVVGATRASLIEYIRSFKQEVK